MFVDYALDASLEESHIGRFVRFTGDMTVGLCTAPGAEVGILSHWYSEGSGSVLQVSGAIRILAGADLLAGDRITSDTQGRATPGGTFALVQEGCLAGAMATALLTVLPASTSTKVDGPHTSDGKLIFLPNIFPGGTQMYLCGAGDSPVDGRGEGAPFNLSSEDANDVTREFGFSDAVYLAGGTMMWKGAELGDTVSLEAFAPASVIAANGGGTGNCTVHASGILIPAAGNGTHDVDLSAGKPVPIPAFDDDTGARSGMWEFSADDVGLGIVVPASPGQGNCDLIPAVVPLARFAARMQLLGDGSMNLQLPAIKPKLLWPGWRMKATVKNSGHAGLRVAWMLISARYATL